MMSCGQSIPISWLCAEQTAEEQGLLCPLGIHAHLEEVFASIGCDHCDHMIIFDFVYLFFFV